MSPDGSEQSPLPPLPSLQDLVIPRRPSGIPYAEGEEYDARSLLTANGFDLETDQLIALLDVDFGILQAAAARVLGARQERTSIVKLTQLALDGAMEETARVQAAYALARMEEPGGREQLVELLGYSVGASPAPLQAAAALASLGNPLGFDKVSKGLDSPNRLIAMVACKQLYAFVPLDGSPLADNVFVDVYQAYSRALERSEPNIVGEALAQLAELDTRQAHAILSGEADNIT